MMDIMEGIKEKQELSNEFNHPVKIEIKDQELGFQSLDFSDQTMDHDSLGDQNDGVTKKLNEMTIEGLSGEEEGSEMVVALETEGGFDKGGNFMVEFGGESDQGGLGGFRDGGGDDEGEIEEKKPEKLSVVEGNEGDKVGSELCENENLVGDRGLEGFINDEVRIEESGSGKFGVVEGNEVDFEGVKEGGVENENRVGDRDLEVFINDEVKIEERKSGKLCVEEGDEDDFKEMKEGGQDEEGAKWSEIENEVGDLDLEGVKDEAKIQERNPEKRSVVEENEGDYKEMKDGGNNKEGSKWGKIEDVEENNNLDVNDEKDGKGKEVILDYEDGWGGNWDDVAVRPEYNLEQQYFDRNGEAQYDEEPHRYGNAEKDSVGLNDGNFGSDHYPLRPAAEDCSFYMRTGTCKFGSNCKFNHPLERKNQAARDIFKQKEEIYDKPKQAECKYYLSSGGCKYGKACRYNHGRGKAAVTPNLELNFLGLPIRVGEKECPFFMRTGSCKYGSNCRFHHPDPTVAGGDDTTSPGRGSTSPRTLIKTAPFGPVIYPPTPSAPPNAEWNGYQAPAYRTSQRNLPVPPALSMNILATDSSFYAQPGSHLVVDEFPERPGQPECSFYLKTGDCKYRSSCKFHHPKNPKTSVTLSNEGLPLRPGQSICSHFSRYGICKFGPSCKYDHSVGDNAASSNGSDQGRPIQFNCFADEYGEWETEPMRSV